MACMQVRFCHMQRPTKMPGNGRGSVGNNERCTPMPCKSDRLSVSMCLYSTSKSRTPR